MDRAGWRAAIHGVAKSQTRASDWSELNWTELNCTSEVISTILSSRSVICSSASDILLLIPSRIFSLLVIILFVCVYLFFYSSSFLLIESCIFPILFSRFWIIFYHYSELFFQGLCQYLLNFFFFFLDFCVTILLLHLYRISVPFNYLFLSLLCLRSPFPRLQSWNHFSFWCLPSSGWSSGLCMLLIGWNLCWVFVVCFYSNRQGCMRW